MVPVCDKRYHIYNRFRHFWAEIKKVWNYPLSMVFYPSPTPIDNVHAPLIISKQDQYYCIVV